MNLGDQFKTKSLKNQFGELIDLSEYIGKKPCIVFFYPKDFTPGCTKEVCSFQDNLAVFNDLGIEVFGISGDNVEKHKRFAEQYKVQYDLLSDEDNSFRKEVGVPSDMFGLLPGRVTYMIDDKGVVNDILKSQMNIQKHMEKAKSFAESFSRV